ncbi:MAG: homoserine kinase [Armatimonadota bacterium]|nr:homoserine kinase [Armatimonadota bacterium]MDR7533195.1 homoserine kinase [Armatimonadota bacterium]MDR7535417.1 homoserine kinase [Armatimonadota bacterium]
MAVALDQVTVQVPATVANLGPGFDCLGAAVGLFAEVTLAAAPTPSVEVAGVDVPQDVSNLIYRSAQVAAAATGWQGAFALRARSPIPLRSGLGSSAAAIVGGLVAAHRLLGDALDAERLLRLATDLEGHPDNVAAALFGGVVIVARDGTALRWARIVPALPVAVVLAVPALEVETAAARRVLPAQVERADAVFNLAQVALVVAALATGQAGALRGALRDRLHQPYRASLVPGFEAVVGAAEAAGAYGAVLSGSGPTVAALAPPEAAGAVGAAMVAAFAAVGVHSRAIETRIEPRGALAT